MAAQKSKKKRSKKKPPSPIALATSDFYGNTLSLYEDNLLHLQGKHGLGVDVIDTAVQSPMRIRVSTVAYANAFAFETRSSKTSDHLRVMVHYPPDADIKQGTTMGNIKTAYVVDYANPSNVGDVVFEAAHSDLPDPDKSK